MWTKIKCFFGYHKYEFLQGEHVWSWYSFGASEWKLRYKCLECGKIKDEKYLL